MAKTDWSINDVVRPQDMNDIGVEINQLRDDVDHIEVPPASTTQAGIVQLSNATNGTRENVAATEKAVKTVNEAAAAAQNTANSANQAAAAAQQTANQSLTAGNERKAELVAALVAKGVAATTSETWESLIGKVIALIKATGNATAADLLSGKTASNVSGPITGTMPNRSRAALGGGYVAPKSTNQDGGGNLVIEPQTGYYTEGLNAGGYGSIILNDPDFVTGNIAKDVNIFGLQGALERLTTAEKQAFADAITGKGVAATVADSNAVLAQKINQIPLGKKVAYGSKLPDAGSNQRNVFTITGLAFTPKTIFARVDYGESFKYYVTVDPNSATNAVIVVNKNQNSLELSSVYGTNLTDSRVIITANGFIFNCNLNGSMDRPLHYVVIE